MGRDVRAMAYDVAERVGQCVEVFCQQLGVGEALLSKRAVGARFAACSVGSTRQMRRAVLQRQLRFVAQGGAGLQGERSEQRAIQAGCSCLEESAVGARITRPGVLKASVPWRRPPTGGRQLTLKACAA
eukprot:9687225-Alexandrium_andersonii.AAC.1